MLQTKGYLLKIAITFIVLICLQHCKSDDSSIRDNRISSPNIGGFDSSIYEVLGGYSLHKLNGDKAWSMSLKNKPTSVINIDSISSYNGVIFLYSSKTFARDTLEAQSWFAINPKEKTENQFESYEDFKKYLTKNNVKYRLFYIEKYVKSIQ